MKLLTFFIIMALAMLLVISPACSAPEKGETEEEEEEAAFAEAGAAATNRPNQPSPLRGTSRFLGQTKNAKALKCNKNPKICLAAGSPGPNCCKKKCVNLTTDRLNCGVCGKKCKYTEACCNGNCVNLAFDKRHCGKCNNSCKKGDSCAYGLCSYS